MRIAFVGKGGSGKTTLASLLARYVATKQKPVVCFDADINQHFSSALGVKTQAKALSDDLLSLKTHFRGTNTRILAPEHMLKTTPPGPGSNFWNTKNLQALTPYIDTSNEGIHLLRSGEFTDDDIGVKCYHAKTGSVELLLNHLTDSPEETIIVDMTAGADAFASGLFTKFDLTCIVVEPTKKSVSVYEQYVKHADAFGINILAVANKVTSNADIEFIKNELKEPIFVQFPVDQSIKTFEQTGTLPEITPEIQKNLDVLLKFAHATPRDWEKMQSHTEIFHRRNALGWANASYGANLEQQIAPDFNLKEHIEKCACCD